MKLNPFCLGVYVLTLLPPVALSQAPVRPDTTIYNPSQLDPGWRLGNTNADEFGSIMRRHYPVYLPAAAASGTVILELVVGSDGIVEPATVHVVLDETERLGSRAADKAFWTPSIEVVKELKFPPALYQGRSVRVGFWLPVTWTPELRPSTR